MLTINPVKFNTYSKKYISFGERNSNNSRVGLMSLDRNANAKINFEKDLHDTKNADMVQSNPIKALGYNLIKAYNILSTPKKISNQSSAEYYHIPYMA